MNDHADQGAVVGTVRRVGQGVRQIERTAWRVAIVSGASGLFLAGVLGVSAWGSPWWIAAPVLLLGAALVLPASILALLAGGIAQLRRIPEGVLDDTSPVLAAVAEAGERNEAGPLRRLWMLGRSLLTSRSALMAARDRLMAAGLMVRLLNPFVLAAVLAAIAATVVLVPVALVTLVVLVV